MKKIILFSLLGSFFIGGTGVIAEVCSGGPGDGCGTYPPVGDVEQTLCLKDANATSFNDKWKSAGSSCNDPRAKIARCFRQKNKAGQDVMSCAAKICNDDTALWLQGGKTQGRCRTMDEILGLSKCDCSHCGPGERCEALIFKWRNGSFGETNAFNGEKPCVCKPIKTELTCDEKYKDNEQKRACICDKKLPWNDKTNTCDCPTGQHWDKNKKQCVQDAKPADPTPAPDTKPCPTDCKDFCTVKIKEEIKCANGKSSVSNKKVKVCKDCITPKMSCEDFEAELNKCDDLECIVERLEKLQKIDELLKGWCKNSVTPYSAPAGDSHDVKMAKSTLSAFFAKAKDERNQSVWKNEEGKFNTSRLASDLTAGVVLGTVGGVVSGVVIKKKQIEKGFDALHCAVGGQTVADWGDTFNVGLRR